MENTEAKEQLAVIKKIMDDSRKINFENGFYYIFWGMLISVALLINYSLIVTNSEIGNVIILWLVISVIGVIIALIYGAKFDKRSNVKTFAGQISNSLWLSLGVAIFSFAFIGNITNAYNPYHISAMISILLGIGYFNSGIIQKINWLRNLGFVWWLGGWSLFYLKGPIIMLIFAIMLILFQTIPGIILYRKYKKELSNELTYQL
ncbi:MAG TPA: hypothetical protein PLG90_04395 [Ignavibacteria bacterium]|nr:hypothetical protein [Ignavibacteria bacterium]